MGYWPWSELGLDDEVPLRDIKRAYARRLKEIDRNNPAAFQALRDAFEACKATVSGGQGEPNRPEMREIAREAPAPAPIRRQVPRAAPIETEETPERDEKAAFWDDLEAAIAAKFHLPFAPERMEHLMSHPMAQALETRKAVEQRLYRAVDSYVGHGLREPNAAVAEFLERHFGWLSDGPALRRLAGHTGRDREIAHALRVAVSQTRWRKLMNSYYPHMTAIAFVLATLVMYEKHAGETLFFVVYTALFGCVTMVLRLVLLIIWDVIKRALTLFGLEGWLIGVKLRYLPKALQRRGKTKAEIGFLWYCIAATLIAVLNITSRIAEAL